MPPPCSRVSAKLAAILIALVGPAVVIAMQSDHGPWTPSGERLLFATVFGLPAVTLFSSTLAFGLAGPVITLWRLVGVALGTVAAFLAGGVLSLPLLYGLSESRTCFGAWTSAMSALLALPPAILHVWARPIPGRRGLQLLAQVAAVGGASAISAATDGTPFCQRPPSVPEELWSTWPAILGVLPAAGLAAAMARPVRIPRGALLLALTALPPYLAKASYELDEVDAVPALLWPARVHERFIGWRERNALIKEVTSIRRGQPVRLGAHLYMFGRVGLWNPFLDMKMRRPDKITGVQVDIPIEDIGLPEIRIANLHWIQLNIGVGRTSREPGPSSDRYIATIDEDLSIFVVIPSIGTFDREVVRDKIRRYIQAARAAAVEQPSEPGEPGK